MFIAIFYYFGNNYLYIMTFGIKNNKQDIEQGFLNKNIIIVINFFKKFLKII